MPITLPPNFREQIAKEKADSPFYWLWQLSGHDGTGGAQQVLLQVVNAPNDISWGGMWFNAFPVLHTPVVEDGAGNLPYSDISLDNSHRLLMPYLQGSANGVRCFLGMPATVWLVNRSDMSAQRYSRWDFTIDDWAATSQVVTLRLAAPNMLSKMVPVDRFNPQICGHQFGNAVSGCPYVVNSFAAFTSCSQLLPDCRARGADQAARNLPVTLPTMFGGFPGVAIER